MNWVVQESRDAIPQGYVRSSAAPAEHVLSMRINLAQNNLAGLEKALEAASSPLSPSFRQWLTTEQASQTAYHPKADAHRKCRLTPMRSHLPRPLKP